MTEGMVNDMTENEAKYYLLEHKPIVGFKTHNEALDIAIQALEEIQQYKAIGLTPELIEAMQGHNVALINDLGEYQAIGTVEECRVAVEKRQIDRCSAESRTHSP